MFLQHFEPTTDLPDEPKEALEKLFELVTIYLLKYYRNTGFTEHGFYSEQQIKTYFTGALLDLSSGYTIQEYRVNRGYLDEESNEKVYSNGAIDYWAFLDSNSYIIELKSYWARYYPQRDGGNYLTIYKDTFLRLNEGLSQIDSIADKLAYRAGNELWGCSICAAPIFVELSSLSEYSEYPLMKYFKEGVTPKMADQKGVSWYLAEFGSQYLHESPKKDPSKKIVYPGIVYFSKVKRLRRN
ncbi:MAG: hypothetical protein SFY70_00360 [Bacteroidia bacterium]|nr:hypothetical protein [Bacteroidia bacterium]